MSNHVHLIASAELGIMLADIIRDLKKFTSKQIEPAIRENHLKAERVPMLQFFVKFFILIQMH